MNTRLSAGLAEKKTPVLALKPFSDIETLLTHILPFAERMVISRGDIVNYYSDETQQCLLLLNGSVALHRRGDGIVLNSESSPFLLGVSSQLATEHLYVRALETSEIARLPLDCFNRIVAQDKLWENFARLLVYTASRVYEHCALISQMSAYDIIRFQLVELMQEHDAIRNNITAAAYIKSRTYLSRSGIMRILAELRTGGYITMHRGILIEINRLPLRY